MNDNDLFQPSVDQPVKKDIGKVLALYFRKWRLFLASVVACIFICILYANYVSTPMYRVSSTMLAKDGYLVPNLYNIATFGSAAPSEPLSNINNIISQLKSKSLMRRVVDELSLTTTYTYDDGVKEVEIYGKDVPIKVVVNKIDSTILNQPFIVTLKSGNTFTLTDYNGETSTLKFGEQIKKPFGTFTIIATDNFSQNSSQQDIIFYCHNSTYIANAYSEALSVIPPSEKSSALVISLVDALPNKGRDIINKLVEIYIRESLEDKKRSINNTISFLDERLKYITRLLSGVEQRVEVYKRRNELTEVSTQASGYVAQAAASDNNLSEWAVQIDILESIENYLNQSPGEYQLVPSTLGIQDQTLVSLINKFNELQLERERLLRTVKPNSPLLKNINEQLTNLQLNILENLRNIKNSLIIKTNTNKANNEKFKSKISKVPSMERDLLEISRQQTIKQSIYEYLLQKREETTIAKAAIVSDFEIIDRASADRFPISPNVPVIFLIALIIGFGAPFVYIFSVNFLKGKVQMKEDVEEVIRLPILEEIPHSYNETVSIVTNSQDPLAEKFKLIRAKLLFGSLTKNSKMLLITSTISGEGKTFFCINLGASLSLAGKKVALIELDFRHPVLAKKLKLRDELGVIDYLNSDTISIVDIIQPLENVPNLSIIAAGGISAISAELMMSSKFADLLTILKERFDYIIIDAPPVGEVADAFYLNSFIDTTLYLVRYNFTLKSQLSTLEGVYKNDSLKNIMVILNDVSINSNDKQISRKLKKQSKQTKQLS